VADGKNTRGPFIGISEEGMDKLGKNAKIRIKEM